MGGLGAVGQFFVAPIGLNVKLRTIDRLYLSGVKVKTSLVGTNFYNLINLGLVLINLVLGRAS